MNRYTRFLICLILSCACKASRAQPPDSIKVLVIYGSRPAKGHPEQFKWFGGRAGGHVGLQIGPDQVLSFHSTKYRPWPHIFPRGKHRNFRSRYGLVTTYRMWQTFNYHDGRDYDTAGIKHLIVTIPITPDQRHRLDSISNAYLASTPYDYAVFGMRCASATYEVLAQTGIFKRPFHHAIWWHLLYPRAIRYYLLKELSNNPTWQASLNKGSAERVWDYDWKLK